MTIKKPQEKIIKEEKKISRKSLHLTPKDKIILDEKHTNQHLSMAEFPEHESLLLDDSAEGSRENIVIPKMKINSGKAFEN